MLTLWGLIEEADVEAYVSTLLLPPYMSHLTRSPFRFDRQPPNPDGLQPLVVTYIGEGRVEEYRIHPEKHAPGLLRTICPAMDLQSIRIEAAEPVWDWSPSYAAADGEDDESDGVAAMRIHFEPVFSTLDRETPGTFDPEECYVSVSRKEMLIGRTVLGAYFAAWIDRISGENERKHAVSEFELIGGGLTFRDERLGGQFFLQDGPAFRELLRFSGLSRILDDVAGIVRLDLDESETEIDLDGFRFRLVPPDVVE